jgi:hypothetical protein
MQLEFSAVAANLTSQRESRRNGNVCFRPKSGYCTLESTERQEVRSPVSLSDCISISATHSFHREFWEQVRSRLQFEYLSVIYLFNEELRNLTFFAKYN